MSYRILSAIVDIVAIPEKSNWLVEAPQNVALGQQLPLWTVLPFIILLLCIAIFPTLKDKWWKLPRHQVLVVGILSTPVLIGFLQLDQQLLIHTGLEYLSFIIYIGGLFTVSGGIFLKNRFPCTPGANTLFLGIGAVLANVIGTTGAGMLLIRPLLEANENRQNVFHIPLFFIFLVCNIGGCLTPLGDPPLFMGLLQGVPFFWTLKLFPQWITAVSILLLIFYLWERTAFKNENKLQIQGPETASWKLDIVGKRNFGFLAIILVAVLLTTQFHHFYQQIGLSHHSGVLADLTRDVIIAGSAYLSYTTTSSKLIQKQPLTFAPIIEVMVLFAGIFITMIPALSILEARGAALSLSQPWEFFWLTGILSSVLDNTPTYLTFVALAKSVVGSHNNLIFADLQQFIQYGVHAEQLLKAISLGAVFMGANSYIGNGPNFMVRSIAEERGLPMPSFFGYMFFAAIILLPVFMIVSLIFFRH